jgi:hypothetical protein
MVIDTDMERRSISPQGNMDIPRNSGAGMDYGYILGSSFSSVLLAFSWMMTFEGKRMAIISNC